VPRSRRTPLPPSLAGKTEDENENASHHPGAEGVPTVTLTADRDGEDHSEGEEDETAKHSVSVRFALWLNGSFRALVLQPTREIKGFASVAVIIISMVLAAKASASLPERARSVSSIVLSSGGSLLVVDYFRDKLAERVRDCLLVVMTLVVGTFSYARFNRLHPWLVHLLVASVCGALVVFGYEIARRLHKWPKAPRIDISDRAIIVFGCWLIAIAAVLAINPL
jgi:hypothetical protein